jgi:hypothetical protein
LYFYIGWLHLCFPQTPSFKFHAFDKYLWDGAMATTMDCPIRSMGNDLKLHISITFDWAYN